AEVEACVIRFAGLYSSQFWSIFGGSLGFVGMTACLFDSSRVVMHEFYRSRISRFYLGAFFFFQAEDGIRDKLVTGVQTCALPISICSKQPAAWARVRGPSRESAG